MSKTEARRAQEHRQPLEPVGDLGGDRREVDASRLLEVGELRDLHPVEEDLPADAPGAERRRLPVVLLEADVVTLEIDADRAEAVEVDLLHVERRRLEDDLELIVLAEAERVLAVARRQRGGARAERTPTRQGSGPRTRRNVAGCIVPAPTSRSHGCSIDASALGPELLEREDERLEGEAPRHGRAF